MGKAWARGDFCTLAPDKLFGVDLSGCCYLHDCDYLIKRMTRKDADFLLKKNIQSEFDKQNKYKLGLIVSNIYYIFVRLFGGIYWK